MNKSMNQKSIQQLQAENIREVVHVTEEKAGLQIAAMMKELHIKGVDISYKEAVSACQDLHEELLGVDKAKAVALKQEYDALVKGVYTDNALKNLSDEQTLLLLHWYYLSLTIALK